MASPPPISGVLLLCLDVQAPFLGVMPDGDRVLKRCRLAAAAAQGLGIPVAFTEQVPQKLGPTVPDLLAEAPGAPQYGKTTFSALADDGIRDAIRAFDVDHLLLCGIETPVCVYQTALDALDHQFQVTLLSDAITARRADDAAVAADALIRAGVHVLPAETVFYALLRDARHPFFKSYTQLVKDHA